MLLHVMNIYDMVSGKLISANRIGGFCGVGWSRMCGLNPRGPVFAIILVIIISVDICLGCIGIIYYLIRAFTILCCLIVSILRNLLVKSLKLCSVYGL